MRQWTKRGMSSATPSASSSSTRATTSSPTFKTLYIDDLCVDENIRGQHIGRRLYEYVKQYAKETGCYNLT